MGNSLRRIILAPAVEYPDVVRFAEALRAAQVPAVLTYATLESSKPRRPELRAARDARVRVVDLDTHATGERLVSIADETLIAGKYLYRDVDDEGRDECIPSREWLQATFAVSGLEWLLEPEEHPVPWESTNLYCFPLNPPELGVTFPFSVALLQVFAPGQPVSCPRCGVSFTPRRQRTQCPAEPSIVELFESDTDAMRTEAVPLDAWGHGRCPRCRRSRAFTRRLEQCLRCGRLMRGEPGRHAVALQENEGELHALQRARERAREVK